MHLTPEEAVSTQEDEDECHQYQDSTTIVTPTEYQNATTVERWVTWLVHAITSTSRRIIEAIQEEEKHHHHQPQETITIQDLQDTNHHDHVTAQEISQEKGEEIIQEKEEEITQEKEEETETTREAEVAKEKNQEKGAAREATRQQQQLMTNEQQETLYT